MVWLYLANAVRMTFLMHWTAALLLLLVGTVASRAAAPVDFQVAPDPDIERPWPGPELWANPLTDWRVTQSALVCEHPGGHRNVVVLTRELSVRAEAFRMEVIVDAMSPELEPRGGWAGFQVGLQGRFGDYRDSAVFGRGLAAGLDFRGRLFLGAPGEDGVVVENAFHGTRLELVAEPREGRYRLRLRAWDAVGGKELGGVVRDGVDSSWLQGLVALAVSTSPAMSVNPTTPRPAFAAMGLPGQQRGGKARMAFREFRASGPKFDAHPERAFGPILWCQHSLQNNGILKLSAQFAPLGRGRQRASLELDGARVAQEDIDALSSTALFRVEGIDPRRAHAYAVVIQGEHIPESRFAGTLRPLPAEDRGLVLAALSCNDGTGFPHIDLVANVASHHPDLLAFLGDQIYEGVGGYGVLYNGGERSVLDYLRKYFLHGWAWRELLRDIPSLTLPDDHDVFHGNLWGNGGRRADTSTGFGAAAQDSGGYKMPAEFVNAVHRTQTGSLPDPVDPLPTGQGIGVYFTRWEFGPLDLAIVADRQWKSAPKPLLPAADILNGFARSTNWNPRTEARHPDAQLLGPRQEAFLENWARHQSPGGRFRVVLSQTPWNCLATLPRGQERSDSVVPSLPILRMGEYPPDDVPTIDFDSNGWPQDKRNLALGLLREAGCLLHIAGDQHLGSTGRYGIEAFRDGPYWLATPAIANLWPRRWFPRDSGGQAAPGSPRYTGDYDDQFGNKLTVLAVANPRHTDRGLPVQIGDRAPGYAVVRFDAVRRTAILEVWPYWASPAQPAPDNLPYPGWPITVGP